MIHMTSTQILTLQKSLVIFHWVHRMPSYSNSYKVGDEHLLRAARSRQILSIAHLCAWKAKRRKSTTVMSKMEIIELLMKVWISIRIFLINFLERKTSPRYQRAWSIWTHRNGKTLGATKEMQMTNDYHSATIKYMISCFEMNLC